MGTLHFPWLEISILLPLLGAMIIGRYRKPERQQTAAVVFASLSFVCAMAEWIDFQGLHVTEAHDRWDPWTRWLGDSFLVLDELSAPILPVVASLFGLIALATSKSKIQRFSFQNMLVLQAIYVATFSTRNTLELIVLLAISLYLPTQEYRIRHRRVRAFAIYSVGMLATLLLGTILESFDAVRLIGQLLVCLGVLARSGIPPFHGWMTDLFVNITFGKAILFSTPLVGIYAALRLLLPSAPDWFLELLVIWGLAASFYAAGMASVQQDARRFYCFVVIQQSSLMLAGIGLMNRLSLTGVQTMWLTVAVALTGLGLTLRGLEARLGRLSLNRDHGMYGQVPILAILYLVTGLASVGFPGTMGFIAVELLVESATDFSTWAGAIMVAIAAINGVSLMRVYFQLFTGVRHKTTVDLSGRRSEYFAAVCLTLFMIGIGIYPQPWIHSCLHATQTVLVPSRPALLHFPNEDAQVQIERAVEFIDEPTASIERTDTHAGFDLTPTE